MILRLRFFENPLTLFRCRFEALRSISGITFPWEGMCRSSRANQIWSLQSRELSGTCSILAFKIGFSVRISVRIFKYHSASVRILVRILIHPTFSVRICVRIFNNFYFSVRILVRIYNNKR